MKLVQIPKEHGTDRIVTLQRRPDAEAGPPL